MFEPNYRVSKLTHHFIRRRDSVKMRRLNVTLFTPLSSTWRRRITWKWARCKTLELLGDGYWYWLVGTGGCLDLDEVGFKEESFRTLMRNVAKDNIRRYTHIMHLTWNHPSSKCFKCFPLCGGDLLIKLKYPFLLMPRKDWYGSQSQPVQLPGQRCDQKVREDASGEKGGPCKGPKRAAWCWLVWQYDWCRVRFGHLMSFHVLCDRQEKEQRDNEERARRRKVIEVRVKLCRLKIVDPTWFSILTYAYLGKEKDRKRRCKAPRRREGHGTRSTAAMTSLPLDAHSARELSFHHRFAVPPQMSLTLADFDQFFGFRRWNHTLPSKTWIRPQTWVKASKMHISVGLDTLDAHSNMQVH